MSGTRVLVAGGDAAHRSAIAGMMEARGFRVLIAEQFQEMLVEARNGVPDLVLVAGSVDGIREDEVCRSLTESPWPRHAPVLVLSDRRDSRAAARALRAGAADYVGLPCEPDEIVERARRLARMRSAHVDLDRYNEELRQLRSLRAGLMRKVAHDLCSPLTALIGSIDLAHSRLGQSRYHEAGELLINAQEAAVQFDRMIDDVVTVARLDDSQDLPLARECALSEVAGQTVARLMSLAGSTTLRFVNGARDAVVATYPELIERVLGALLLHTLRVERPADEVVVATEADDVHGTVRIRGMRKASAPMAFCRLAVEAQGGRVDLDGSMEGRDGCAIRLPLGSRGSRGR